MSRPFTLTAEQYKQMFFSTKAEQGGYFHKSSDSPAGVVYSSCNKSRKWFQKGARYYEGLALPKHGRGPIDQRGFCTILGAPFKIQNPKYPQFAEGYAAGVMVLSSGFGIYVTDSEIKEARERAREAWWSARDVPFLRRAI